MDHDNTHAVDAWYYVIAGQLWRRKTAKVRRDGKKDCHEGFIASSTNVALK